MELVEAPFRMSYGMYSNAYRSLWARFGPVKVYPPCFAFLTLALAFLACLVAAARYHVAAIRRRPVRVALPADEVPCSMRKPLWRKLTSMTDRRLFLPALLGKDTAHRPSWLGFSFSLPTRAQSVVLMGYVSVNVAACLYGVDAFPANILYTSTSEYWVKTVGDTTGITAVFQLPLMLLLSSRNNLLIAFTGLPFNTFNLFHRWIGRVVIVESIVHSLLYTYRLIWHKHNYWTGGHLKRQLP